MRDITVSNHAFDRAKERCGLSKKAITRTSAKAYDAGISVSQTTGQLFKYVTTQTNKYPERNTSIKLYGDNVYVFAENEYLERTVLVTLFHIPQTLKPHSLGKQKQHAARHKQALSSAY